MVSRVVKVRSTLSVPPFYHFVTRMSSVVTVSIWSPEKANEKVKSVNPCIELACCFCKDLSANRTDANVDCGRQQKHSSVPRFWQVTVILMQNLVQVPSVTLVLWCFSSVRLLWVPLILVSVLVTQ